MRLWIDNKLVIDSWREEFQNLVSIPMVLQAGQRYEFKCEMFDSSGRAMAKVFWSSPSIPRQIIPKSHFSPGPVPEPATPTTAPRFPIGIALIDGSILACKVNAADESSIKIASLNGLTSLSTVRASRLIFQSMSPEIASTLS